MLHFVVLLIFVAGHGAFAQTDCVPDHVGNISLDLNYTLYWEASTNCESTEYMIYIHIEEELQFIYNTNDTFLDVSFLPACEKFYFEIRAFTGHQLSDERHLDTYMPAPSGANLTISHFAVIREEDTLFLIWEVEEKFAHCARGFRIVVRDGWELPRDLYTQHNYYFLGDLVPCGLYEIGVMALYNEVMEGPVRYATHSFPAAHTNRPVLQSVTPGSMYVDITWSVDSYSVNQCELTSIIVESPQINSLVFPVEDKPERPPLTISVGPLLPDRMYTLNVYVVNSFGRSRGFPIAVQTLP